MVIIILICEFRFFSMREKTDHGGETLVSAMTWLAMS